MESCIELVRSDPVARRSDKYHMETSHKLRPNTHLCIPLYLHMLLLACMIFRCIDYSSKCWGLIHYSILSQQIPGKMHTAASHTRDTNCITHSMACSTICKPGAIFAPCKSTLRLTTELLFHMREFQLETKIVVVRVAAVVCAHLYDLGFAESGFEDALVDAVADAASLKVEPRVCELFPL